MAGGTYRAMEFSGTTVEAMTVRTTGLPLSPVPWGGLRVYVGRVLQITAVVPSHS